MSETTNRRDFLRAATVAGAGLAIAPRLYGAEKKSVLVFTKSSGFEHGVVKVVDGKPSIAEGVVREQGIVQFSRKQHRVAETDEQDRGLNLQRVRQVFRHVGNQPPRQRQDRHGQDGVE